MSAQHPGAQPASTPEPLPSKPKKEAEGETLGYPRVGIGKVWMVSTEGLSRIEVHPAADLFPDMAIDELAELTADMKCHGYNGQPIILQPVGEDLAYGSLVDGRHRLKAARAAGVELVPVELLHEGADPWLEVLRLNVHRRHLTAAQRADLAVKLLAKVGKLDALDVQAKGRQHSGRPSDPLGRKVSAEHEVATAAKVGKRVARAAVARHRQANGKAPRRTATKAKPSKMTTVVEVLDPANLSILARYCSMNWQPMDVVDLVQQLVGRLPRPAIVALAKSFQKWLAMPTAPPEVEGQATAGAVEEFDPKTSKFVATPNGVGA